MPTPTRKTKKTHQTKNKKTKKKKPKQIQSEGYDFDAAPVVPISPAKPKPIDTSTFAGKLRAAWNIFFPPSSEAARGGRRARSAREEGKNRLRMILVADRCGMTQSSLYEMKHSIVKVLSDFVEVEGGEDLVDVAVTADGDAGTIYSVSVPVKRIKPTVRAGAAAAGTGAASRAPSPSSTVATRTTTAAAAASIRSGGRSSKREEDEAAVDGVSLEWETDPDADASGRFPYGV